MENRPRHHISEIFCSMCAVFTGDGRRRKDLKSRTSLTWPYRDVLVDESAMNKQTPAKPTHIEQKVRRGRRKGDAREQSAISTKCKRWLSEEKFTSLKPC